MQAAQCLTPPLDNLDVNGSIQSGVVATLIHQYTNAVPENIDVNGSIQSGVVDTIIVQYTNWSTLAPENIDVTGSIQAGQVDIIIITYTFWPMESIDVNGQILSGVVT